MIDRTLVLIGARADGRKELITVEDGTASVRSEKGGPLLDQGPRSLLAFFDFPVEHW